MTFQNPLMLAALAVIVLPILLHLLSHAAAPSRPWGAMMFLDNAIPALQRGRSRQRLLLLTRIALLSSLVIAFARPIRSTASTASCELVIVVDTSASMRLSDSGIPRLDRAKAAALRALATLKPGDRAALITGDMTIGPTRDLQSVAARINQLSALRATQELTPLLLAAANELAVASPLSAQCFVTGDLSDSRWNRALGSIASRSANLPRLMTMNLGNGGSNDLVVRNLVVRPGGGSVIAASVDVHNTAAAEQRLSLQWSIDQRNVRTDSIIVPANGSTTIVLQRARIPAGRHLISVALPESAASSASRCDASVDVRESPRLRVVGTSASVVAAAAPGTDVSWSVDLSSADLEQTDLLIFSGGPLPAHDDLEELRDFVDGGGRLLILPGDHFNPPAVQASLAAARLSPVGALAAAPAPAVLPKVAGQTVPVVRQLLWTRLAPGSSEVSSSFPAFPWAVKMPVGDGTVAIASTGLGDAWSTLADDPALRPWLRTLVDTVWPRVVQLDTLRQGDPLVLTVPLPVDAHSASVTTPEGRTEAAYVQRFTDRCELRSAHTPTTGVYRLSYRSRGRPRTQFFVVALRPLPVSTRGAAGHLPATKPVTSAEDLAQSLVTARARAIEGFLPALGAAIVLLAAELYLESPAKRGRA